MAKRLVLGSEAQQVLRHLHPVAKKRLRAALLELKSSWPTPSTLDVKQLRAKNIHHPIYRLRVGPWRAIFLEKEDRLEVVKVMHRRDGYDWLEK